MPFSFTEDPETPGLITVVDPDSGVSRPVWDPRGELRASIMSRVEPAAPLPDYASGAAAPPPVPVPAPAEPPAPEPQAWEASQQPKRPVTVRASGAPMPPPVAPGGTVLQKAKVTMGEPGYTYDKAAEEQRGADLLERTEEQNRRQQAYDAVLGEQQIELERQKNEAARREQLNAERATRFERELNDTVKREINPDRIKENTPVMGSILGIVGQALGMLSLPGSGVARWQEQVQTNLDRRIQRDIDAQKEEKESTINLLTKQLGSAQQAENHYRAATTALAADVLETRLKRMGLADQYADQIQGLRDQALAYNEAAKAASFGKPGKAEYTFERPKNAGAGPAYTNETLTALKALGVDEKRYREGLDAKVMAAQNAPTIAMAADTTRRIDSDINLIQSIAAENGGTIPQTGPIKIPDWVARKLAQAGYAPGMTAEKVGQLLNGYVNQQARAYGGAITEADREAAKTETGSSTEGIMFFLGRMRDKNNDAIRTALEKEFPGRGQKVFELMLRGSGGNAGVPETSPKPFEKQNAPEAPPTEPAQAPTDLEQRQAANRASVKKRFTDFFSGMAPIQGPRYGAKF
jgi:hypothetical protein